MYLPGLPTKPHCFARSLFILSKAIAFLAALVFLTSVFLGKSVTLTGEQMTDFGLARNTSAYLQMRDGERIAVDIWLPSEIKAGENVPALIRATRYGRAVSVTFAYRICAALGQRTLDVNLRSDIRAFNQAGFAVIRVDARGTGASSGDRDIEFSEEEIDDYLEVIDWTSKQLWCNGRIGAYGVSYDANTSELMARHGHPALKAVAPLYGYYDFYENLVRPGGVFNVWFVENWSEGTKLMDTNSLLTGPGWGRWSARQLFHAIKPVDQDTGGAALAKILSERDHPLVFSSVRDSEFRDDAYGQTVFSIDSRSPYLFSKPIETAGVAMNPWVGWYDSATVEGALWRFANQSNPQQLVIGPMTHGGKHDANPYVDQHTSISPSITEQHDRLIEFFTPFLHGEDEPTAMPSQIRYYTMGQNVWKTTDTWPPKKSSIKTMYFASEGVLSERAPVSEEGNDSYEVDFTASTGKSSRWHTISGPDVFYPDRQEEDKKLLTYTSDPLPKDVEITGKPIVSLYLDSSTTDGALHVYLEDVGPLGEVTYLTEGILRLANRKLTEEPTPADYVQGPHRSFEREDAVDFVPGTIEEVVVPLYTISAQIKQNHRLRIAIAGGDRAIFERFPEDETPIYTVYRNRQFPTSVALPIVEK